jgi:2-haloalkanoic acid dehalogenase type II
VDSPGIQVVTFDCYGTLVDWEAGILSAVLPLLAGYGVERDSRRVLEAFARAEAAIEAQTPFIRYAEVLRRTFVQMAKDLGFTPRPDDAGVLLDTFHSWPIFSDTTEGLRRIASCVPIGLISNVDDELVAHTIRRLDAPFSTVVTAEQVGAYKPDSRVFERAADALRRAKTSTRQGWLHAGQSAFHDLAPARAFGLGTAHVLRANSRGASAVPSCAFEADVVAATVMALADYVEERRP